MFVGFRHKPISHQIKIMLQTRLTVFIVIFSIFFISCKTKAQKEKFENTETYNFANPKIINLPQSLDEISGIAYYPKDTSVFAIIDEDGLMFKVSLNRPEEVKEWRFDKQRDFEDIVYLDSTFYVMVSNGDIDKITFNGDKMAVAKVDFPNASKKVNEFESLYYSADSNKLILLCKQCEDDKKSTLSSYFFSDSAHQFVTYRTMETEQLFQKIGSKKEKIKPSAAAVNPVTKELYVLCSVNKILFIQDAQGKIKEVVKLDPVLYKQPEGMAFTPTGDLIISNEVAEGGYATLLLLKNKKNNK